jgi:hypothetical protein
MHRFISPLPCLLLACLLAGSARAQCEVQVLAPSDPADSDGFGYGADLADDLLAIGAIGGDDACPTNPNCQSGTVYVYRRSGGVWSETARLTASDAVSLDEFGHDIALSGDRMIVGAHRKGPGAAYVYTYDGVSWGDEQKLIGSGTQSNYHFGHSVGLDGDFALVGTMRDPHAGFETGSAYLFRNVGGNWVEEANLTGSTSGMGDRFGRSCDISGDYAAVGAHLNDGIGTDSGAAYIFERDDNGTPGNLADDTWPEAAALIPSDTHPGQLFGRSVDVDGNLMIVGASQDISNGVKGGAAYLFFRTGSGWTEVQKLIPDDAVDSGFFGISVSLDGIYAIVGASGDDEAAFNAGAAYVFTRTPQGYIQTGKLLGSTLSANANSGNETGVHVQGTTALYTARFNSAGLPLSGAAYMYQLDDCLGTNYCAITPNSAGPGAVIQGSGIQSISDNSFTVTSYGTVPNKVGLFFYGANQIDVPLGDGRLCVGGVVRLNPPLVSDSQGVASRQVDFTTAPAGVGPNAITAGSTWNFQYWYRDPQGGGSGFNLSDAAEVTFIP